MENKGVIYLDDEWEHFYFRCWKNSIASNGLGLTVDAQIVFAYADQFGIKKPEALEMVREIEGGINRE